MKKKTNEPDKKLNSVKFECIAGCSECCKLSGGFVFLSEDEAQKIAEYLKTDEENFLKFFTRIIDDQLALVDGDEDNCVFLEDDLCMIYDVRPLQCRTYPFWSSNMKTKERWALTKEECPGIGKGRSYSPQDIADILKGKSLDSFKEK